MKIVTNYFHLKNFIKSRSFSNKPKVLKQLAFPYRSFSSESLKEKNSPDTVESISDLDHLPKHFYDYVDTLKEKYPGYNDEKYMKWLNDLRFAPSKVGSVYPVTYEKEHIEVWQIVYSKLRDLHIKYACNEHIYNLLQLENFGFYSTTSIPTFENINKFLQQKTGFQLVNIGGMINPRTFLNALNFGVFYSTQYIRYPTDPFYAVEPDIIHELLGHVPMFADKKFAEFSREIGRISLNATDREIEDIAKVYFYSIEFGVMGEKILGAGILGSCLEMEHVGSGKGKILPWDLEEVLKREYILSEYQPCYSDIESLDNLREIFEQLKAYLGKQHK